MDPRCPTFWAWQGEAGQELLEQGCHDRVGTDLRGAQGLGGLEPRGRWEGLLEGHT